MSNKPLLTFKTPVYITPNTYACPYTGPEIYQGSLCHKCSLDGITCQYFDDKEVCELCPKRVSEDNFKGEK
jgi:hypothetical protein